MSLVRPVRSLALLAAFASLALAGCMKVNEKNVLSKDGSGTATISMSMDKAKLKEMEEMAKAFGGGAEGGGSMDDFDVEKAKKKWAAKEGIKVVSVDPIDDEKNKGVKVVVKYESLEKYYASGAGGSDGNKITLADNGGTWVLTRESEKGMEGGGEEMLGMMAEMMAGLDVSMSIEVPEGTTITETNGTKNEAGNVVTWSLTDKDLANKEKMAALKKMTVSFKGESLALKAFSITVKDTEEKPEGGAEKEGEEGGK